MKLLLSPLTRAAAGIGALTASLFMFASNTFAQISNPVISEEIGTIQSSSCDAGNIFVQYFILVWNAVISIGALVVMVMFIWGAIEWLSADGEASKVAKARGRMLNAALGMLLLVASFAIISFISLVFFGENFNLLNFSLPTALECGGDSGAGGGFTGPGTVTNPGGDIISR